MIGTVDGDLIRAAQGGDSGALERLLTQCRPGLHGYARRYCKTSADAEDAVQESCLLLCRYLPTLRSVLSFTGWLLRIARRECDRLTRRMLRQGVPLDEATAERYLTTRDDTQLRVEIALAIQSLPDIYRGVIVLRDFEERTVKEIAAQLGMPTETVKTRIHRGRQLIREHLLA